MNYLLISVFNGKSHFTRGYHDFMKFLLSSQVSCWELNSVNSFQILEIGVNVFEWDHC